MLEGVGVLLVEDDVSDARLLQELLGRGRGHRVEHVTTLAAALERLVSGAAPDVVLLDLNLPDSVGLATLRTTLEGPHDLPVVVLTGLDDDRVAHDAIEAGAQDYLVKGTVNAEVMTRVVRHAIDRHQLQSALRERVKEMAGLYAISQTLHGELAPAEVAAEVAGHLVRAMQWPRLTHAGVALDEAEGEAGTPLTLTDAPTLTADVEVAGRTRGRIRVAVDRTDHPFLLPEEQQLIDAAADALAGWVLRRDAEHQRALQRVELDATRERLEGLFRNASDAMILITADGSVLDANPAASELTGYEHGELAAMSVWDLAPGAPDDDAEVAAARRLWGRFLASGTVAGEFRIGRRDGTVAVTDSRAVADIVDGVHLWTLRDVTARKRAEEALAASEARFRAMAESAEDAIYRLRLVPETRFDFLNAAIERITGFARSTFEDDPLLFVERVHPDDVESLDPDRLVDDEIMRVTVRFQRADGAWIWLEYRRAAIVEDGQVVGVQGVIRDMTAREETERALRDALESERRAADRLRALDDLKSSFLQAVSHELRTPLTSLLGYIRTLVNRTEQLSPEQVADFHRRLLSNANRLDALLTDLLDVERLSRGTVRLDLQPTDLSQLAAEVAASIDFGERTCTVAATPAVAEVDPRKIERVLHNLLVNAVRHTPPGTTVWVTARIEDAVAVVEVADDGPGIAADDRAHIFDPFWQGASTRDEASPGTGIGLSLVQRFAALHGGRAAVDARPEGGTVFTVTLPVGRAERSALARSRVTIVPAAADDEELVFHTLMEDTLAQLRATSDPAEATGIVLTFVERAGAQLIGLDDDGDAIDVGLSVGEPQPLRAAAPHGSAVRRRLEHHLPFLIEQAGRELARRTHAGLGPVDPRTGALRPEALGRVLDGLAATDAVAVVALAHPDGPGRRLEDPAATATLATLARELSRRDDHVALTASDEVVLVLADTPEDRADTLIRRLREAWRVEPERPGEVIGGAAGVGESDGHEALARAVVSLEALRP